ncbi:hypothetical protein ACVILK_004797 [Bradyrhizobium embrapense]
MPSPPAPDQIASPPPAAMTLREFCAWSRLGRTATYREIKLGRLRLVKAGAKSLILVADAERWLRALPAASAS